MRVTGVAIGKLKKGSAEQLLIDEYVKRSNWQISFKEKDNSNQRDEAEFLQKAVPNGAKVVVLDERGENLSSVELAGKIEKWQVDGNSEVCFLIGGADGHLPETRKIADMVLSFGKLTLPHMLMRVVLAEQIYRVEKIIEGHPYHRE